jgi:hypothetical protein
MTAELDIGHWISSKEQQNIEQEICRVLDKTFLQSFIHEK